jgi:23S rRNA (adenine2503-C2)-methyltransferase
VVVSDITCLNTQHSSDGSIKFLWQFPDQKLVESIYFTFPDAGEERPFLCISSQDGCNVRCSFCATGQQRMRKNLMASEIIAQVVNSLHIVQAAGGPASLFHVAFAGMGEPLLNYEQVVAAAAHLRAEGLAEIVSVSTSGIVPRIQELAHVVQHSVNRLYISLHATTDELRNQLVPTNKKYPLTQVIAAATEYAHRTATKVTATYLLFADTNDTDEDVQRLLALLDPERFIVQLSVWNHVEGLHFVPSPRLDTFYEILTQHGYEAFIQQSKGSDIDGGCGQLRARPLPLLRLGKNRSYPPASISG